MTSLKTPDGSTSPSNKAVDPHLRRLTSNEIQIMENLRQMELQYLSNPVKTNSNHIIVSRSPTMIIPKSLYSIKHKVVSKMQQYG